MPKKCRKKNQKKEELYSVRLFEQTDDELASGGDKGEDVGSPKGCDGEPRLHSQQPFPLMLMKRSSHVLLEFEKNVRRTREKNKSNVPFWHVALEFKTVSPKRPISDGAL